MLHVEPVHLARELLAELLEEVLTQEFLLQRVQDTRLHFVAPDGQVVLARPLVTGTEAGEAIR